MLLPNLVRNSRLIIFWQIFSRNYAKKLSRNLYYFTTVCCIYASNLCAKFS
jgi:hypothetical protein